MKTETDIFDEATSGKSDDVYFEEGLKTTKNKKPGLLWAISKATKNMSKENILNVVKAAACMDDFVTSLYWHQKVNISLPGDLSVKFERYFFELLASAQKKKVPDAKPITSVEQLLQHRSDVSSALRNPEYLKIKNAYEKLKTDKYVEEFNSEEFEENILKSAMKKHKRTDTLSGCFMLLVWIAGVVGLWKTCPIVWHWANDSFGVLFFLLPLLYVIVFAVITILISTIFLSSADKNLKKVFIKHEEEIKAKLHKTAEYITFKKMNAGLPEEYHQYSKRLILAALSAMTGEKDLKRLCQLADKENEYTWLCTCRDDYSPIDQTKCNRKVLALAREGATDEELAMVYVLFTRSMEDKLKEYLEKSKNSKNDFIEIIISTRNFMYFDNIYTYAFSKPADHIINLPYCFLAKEVENAEKALNYPLLGEACYRIYDLGIRAHRYGTTEKHDFHGIACVFGIKGMNYSDKLKFRAMNEYAVYEDSRNFKLSLHQNREAAIEYMNELRAKGDSRWQQLQKSLDSAKYREVENEKEEEWREYQKEVAAERAAQRAEALREEHEKQVLRDKLEAKADAFERDLDLMGRGDGYTIEERRIRGDISDVDAARLKSMRDRAIDKKVDG